MPQAAGSSERGNDISGCTKVGDLNNSATINFAGVRSVE